MEHENSGETTLVLAKKSPQINELAIALAKVQGALRPAKKDAQNPHLKNTYASLDSVWEACRRLLSENGLAPIQIPTSHNGDQYLETTLVHSSGQWISGALRLDSMPENRGVNSLQALGGGLTYARRYMLAAMIGVTTGDDDDGNSWGGGNRGQQRQQQNKNGSSANREPQERPLNTDVLKVNFEKAVKQLKFSGKLEDQPEISNEVVENLQERLIGLFAGQLSPGDTNKILRAFMQGVFGVTLSQLKVPQGQVLERYLSKETEHVKTEIMNFSKAETS